MGVAAQHHAPQKSGADNMCSLGIEVSPHTYKTTCQYTCFKQKAPVSKEIFAGNSTIFDSETREVG
jgi:hypothetical protein